MHTETTASASLGQVVLRAQQLTKRFGGLAAVNEVSLELQHGRLHAVIGPNGAGKSTLTHLLSGDLPLTSGYIELLGRDMSRAQSAAFSRSGLGRSYQKTNIFRTFTVWENVRLAAQSREQQSPLNPLSWLQTAARRTSINERAERALELAGLQSRKHTVAGAASHGEQRQLEIAMTLATEPQVLLLDEPLAGMGTAEAQRIIELLQGLKTRHAIMLVEHDMDAIFTLADLLTVMVNGQVIATGSPAEVRANADVQAAYLGEDH